MAESNETLDGIKNDSEKKSFTQTVSTLAFVGNSVIGFLFLLLFVACIINGAKTLEAISIKDTTSGGIVQYTLISILILGMCIVSLIGLKKIKNGKRKGFYMYAIANGVWVLSLLYAGSDGGYVLIAIAILSVLFIAFYALKLPKLS